MHVEVTQQDIEQGIPLSFCYCPIALALRRVAPEPYRDNPDNFKILDREIILVWDILRTYPHTEATQKFINDFDNGNPVEPFAFDLPFEPFAVDLPRTSV